MLVSSPKRLHQQEKWKVEFNDEDKDLVCDEERNDPMVMSETIPGFEVKRILVDNSSAVEVLTLDAYQKMWLKEQNLKRASHFYGFANHLVKEPQIISHTLTTFDVTACGRNPLSLSSDLGDVVVNSSQEQTSSAAKPKYWKVYVDGSTARIGPGARVLLVDPDKNEWQYGLSFGFQASKNAAEYEALISGLQLALQLGARKLIIHIDS
ncbi:hypothetical protein PVK06_007582 [Gossypium arboreum]|uniref:RNase H type-1 domain-containing protein n=1 Tax=Gossypium arboreum TaxID=29729 RepID=A0ABR0QHQ3_GOSAR|nr:hypothetical protein PVK06_007582 [Gossypium arboreum]